MRLPFRTVYCARHALHPGSVAERLANDGLAPCFLSDLSNVIERRRPALWIPRRA